jgi:hypothetical protein
MEWEMEQGKGKGDHVISLRNELASIYFTRGLVKFELGEDGESMDVCGSGIKF